LWAHEPSFERKGYYAAKCGARECHRSQVAVDSIFLPPTTQEDGRGTGGADGTHFRETKTVLLLCSALTKNAARIESTKKVEMQAAIASALALLVLGDGLYNKEMLHTAPDAVCLDGSPGAFYFR
jgi:hypothetical protein